LGTELTFLVERLGGRAHQVAIERDTLSIIVLAFAGGGILWPTMLTVIS